MGYRATPLLTVVIFLHFGLQAKYLSQLVEQRERGGAEVEISLPICRGQAWGKVVEHKYSTKVSQRNPNEILATPKIQYSSFLPITASRNLFGPQLSTQLRTMFPFKLLALLPLFTPLTAAQCNSDNCLRALRGHTSSAIPFCATYTLTTSAPIATWVASPCQTNPSRVSSACNCAVTAPPTPVVATTDNVKYSPPWEAYNVRSDPVGGYTYEE